MRHHQIYTSLSRRLIGLCRQARSDSIRSYLLKVDEWDRMSSCTWRYCVLRTKVAVRGLSAGLRVEVHGEGIRMTMISPGAVDSELQESTTVEASDLVPHKVWVKKQPTTRSGMLETKDKSSLPVCI